MSTLLAECSTGIEAVLNDHALTQKDREVYWAMREHGTPVSVTRGMALGILTGARGGLYDTTRLLRQRGHLVVKKRMLAKGHWRNEQFFSDQVPTPQIGLRLVPNPKYLSYKDPDLLVVVTQDQCQDQSQEIKKVEEKTTLLPLAAGGEEHPNPVSPKEEPLMLRGQDRDDIDIVNPLAAVPDQVTRPFPAPRGAAARHGKAPDRWTCWDLDAEFTSRVHQAGAGAVPHQTNAKALRGSLGRLIHGGSSPAALAQCIEMFFASPRNLRDLGEDEPPLWRRFLAEITHTYGKAQKILAHDTIMDNEHYAESVALSDAQYDLDIADRADQMAAYLTKARQQVEADEKAIQERAAVITAQQMPVWSNVMRLALEASQKAAEAQTEHARLKAESEARLAEHPDEEWVVEDEEEWIPEDDAAVVEA